MKIRQRNIEATQKPQQREDYGKEAGSYVPIETDSSTYYRLGRENHRKETGFQEFQSAPTVLTSRQ
jgi:hypothetical protein